MALELFSKLLSFWPLWALKFDDLRFSDELVRKLRIPERTKQFVYAVQDPETQSVIYILSAQSLSETSAMDAECLIREVNPDAVIAQLAVSHALETLAEEERELEDYCRANPLPTSSVGVLTRCFVDKVGKQRYEDLAGSLVLREIFGASFHGHCLAAKKTAEEIGSSFSVLESPCLRSLELETGESPPPNKFRAFLNGLVPQQAFGSVAAGGPPRLARRFLLTKDVHLGAVKLLSPYLEASSGPVSEGEIRTPEDGYEVPAFARSFYPLLSDLYAMFSDLPSMSRALAHAQKMLREVSDGEAVGGRTMAEVCRFRVAVEGLRIALNSAGRSPIERPGKTPEFSELSLEEKSRVLFAQTLRARAGKFKTTVAVVDAGSLAGLRRHWHDRVPFDLDHLDGQGAAGETADKKRLLTGKPVVAVGAGATAVIGVSSLSKTVPASFVKLVTLKLPASVKLTLAQTHKAVSLVLGKGLGPAKAGVASAEKIRAVAHGVIASAEKTSLSAMRTAFYEIMRKRRRVAPVGALPWATFGCSVATCSGLLVYGDGIECAVESVPAAPAIASLGRGIERLREVSLRVSPADTTRLQSSVESLMTRLRQVKSN